MLHPDQITGIVLAGGKSSRFGRNKALCEFGESYFLKHLSDLLSHYSKEVLISGHYPEYEKINIPIVKDEHPEIGPIGGIYSALKQCKTEWVLILTCDMPLVSNVMIMMMLASGGRKAILGWHDEIVNTTFPILISKEALPFIEKAIENKRYNIKQMFNWGISKKICVPTELRHQFENINTERDYKKIII